MADGSISGSLIALFLYDVSDEIRLEELRTRLKAPPAGREPIFRQPAPEYVQFEKPPVIEAISGLSFGDDSKLSGRVAYYEYGVASVTLERAFQGTWDEIVDLSAQWMNAPEMEQKAAGFIRRRLEQGAPALVNPYAKHLSEDYYIIYMRDLGVRADVLIRECGEHIAQIVRGERAAFSAAERAEILESRMSYYERDLLVVGWTAALIHDTPEGAAPTIQLLEYANTQLLDFRHYDAVLTRVLSDVYRALDKGSGVLSRWRMARRAERLNTIRLDIRGLTERVDRSIKFLSDMFAARLYRMAAQKIGVPDYRTLVEQKLESANELYRFMMDRFYQGRAFVLESMVVIILIIELVFLFRGEK